ncbi:MAG: SWIM zinc finger family protein [Bacilli bacterium]|nr:SWIM zinc finger family protein [Bacilli bacterium]
MTTRFLLIKHLSLGFGVLLKRENADVGKIYFAEAKAAKSVILSHPYLSVAEGLSLSKFVSMGLYEGLFDEQTKNMGREYLDSIKDMHVAENECYGSIMDGHEYQFRITIDQNSFINISCTCQSAGICKHVYAVFVSMHKLINPKAAGDKAVVAASNTNEFKDSLERFLYVRSAENISLVGKLSHQLFNLEKTKLFLETLLPFYLRGQYKARVISDILAPLFFSKKNEESFNKIKEDASDGIVTMLNEADNYYQNNLLRDYERKGGETKKANLYHILLTPDCLVLASLLKHAEDNYSEERLASQVMVEYLKYNDLTIEDIITLKGCYLFQVNHRYYMNDLLNSPMKNRLSAYLLFFDELPLDENKIKQIPLNYFLQVAPFSNDKSHYVQIVYSYFDQLKEEDMPAFAELLIGICLQHEYIDERTIRLTIELSKKIPSASYIIELVDNNIRRPKKSKAN